MLTFSATGTATPKSERMPLVSSTRNAQSDPALVEPIQQTQMVSQVIRATDNDYKPDCESTLSAKMKADLCHKAADNPTLPMEEVYNQYMDSADTPLDDNPLEPQLRSCRSQMYCARLCKTPHLPPTRDDMMLEG